MRSVITTTVCYGVVIMLCSKYIVLQARDFMKWKVKWRIQSRITALKACEGDVTSMIRASNCNPIMLRLAWSDAGRVYSLHTCHFELEPFYLVVTYEYNQESRAVASLQCSMQFDNCDDDTREVLLTLDRIPNSLSLICIMFYQVRMTETYRYGRYAEGATVVSGWKMKISR